MPTGSKTKSFIRKPLNHKAHFAARFGATYFITICCQERGRNPLCRGDTAKAIFETATIYDKQQIWYLQLLLLMPDHLHALIAVAGDTSLSKVIGNFKRATGKFAGIVWQRNFFDHRLRSAESLKGKAWYIRQNPVRTGLATSYADWLYVLDRAALDVAVR